MAIRVKGIRMDCNKFHELSRRTYHGKKYYLLEHDVYGEEVCVIVDSKFNHITDAPNGWFDLEEKFDNMFL